MSSHRLLLRRLRLFAFLLLFAMPVMGGLLSFLQVFRDGMGVDGLGGVIDIAVSGDGKQVYAVGNHANALTVFNRHETFGTLGFVEFHEDEEDGVFGLLGASGVTVSPDGRHVYATAETDDTLVVFSRDATSDELTFIAAAVKEDLVGGVFGLNGASSVAVSPDDTQVYVTGRIDDALVVFNRDATTDDLTFVDAELDGFGGADGLDGAAAVAASPDDLHVYVASEVDDAVAVFVRNALTGEVAFGSKVEDGIGGVDGLNGASGVAVSPDGEHVYATGRIDNAVAAFERDATTGALTFLAVYRDGVGGVDGLAGAMDVELNPSGTRVLVAGRDDDAVAIFRRDADGSLTFLEAMRDGKSGADGLAGTFALAVLDSHVYAAAHDEDAVSAFELAICYGDVTSGDSDSDAVCDDVDLCLGDDFEGDDDADGVCGDLDVCPGFDDAVDSDGDGAPDGCDQCEGNDASGNDDGDGVCNNLDVCPGASDSFDADGDGVPDGCDDCLGNDADGDSDGDDVCDDVDVCVGNDATGDSDGDGVCNGSDLCLGDNASGDSDGDGFCDDTDLCLGDNASGDSDSDGVCDDGDLCLGDDATGDSDGDDVCDDSDQCLGDDATGDADGDLICADQDCDDNDATDLCPPFFTDGFESGNTTAWTTVQTP